MSHPVRPKRRAWIKQFPLFMRPFIHRLANIMVPSPPVGVPGKLKQTTLTVISSGGVGPQEVSLEVFHRARSAEDVRVAAEKERLKHESPLPGSKEILAALRAARRGTPPS